MKLKIPGFSNYYLETDNNRVYNQRERPLKETIFYDEYKNRGVVTFTLAARHLNVHLTTIRAALIGESKRSCGRYWDYYHGN